MAHNVTPRVSTSPPSSIDAASRPRGSPPNETSSASKACSICAVVSASENGRPSSCKSARFTSSNDLSLPTTAGVKDMRPSLVKPARLQERSHAGRILGRKCLNAKTKPRPARQSSPSLHPQHMPLARASYRCALSTTETTSGSAIRSGPILCRTERDISRTPHQEDPASVEQPDTAPHSGSDGKGRSPCRAD